MDFYPISVAEELTDASIDGKLRSNLNRLIIDLPDDCPKASDVTLSFLSCLADAELVFRLISSGVIGKLEKNMFINARKFKALRSLLVDRHPDQCLHLLFKGFRGINLSDWPEIYREEQRKHDQATYARKFEVTHKQIFFDVKSSKADSFDRDSGSELRSRKGLSLTAQWQTEKERKLSMPTIRLTDAKILPKVGGQGGETIVGALEAHANRFIYMANGISMHLYFVNIKKSFFRLGDKRMPPLLHFHLRDPILVGTEKAKDIQFHLVHCSLGQKRSDQDSDKIEQEKKKIRGAGHNEDLKNFVDEVGDRWNSQLSPPCRFEELDKEYEFYGVLPSKASAGFALTSFSLIVLVETPFLVVPLRDIDIVHLALIRPGEIDMTVIFQDFEVDNVLEINSIPLRSLAAIKHRLNDGLVKYYVNTKKPDWKSIVKGIADFPMNFMENGGWDYFKLEDSHTLAYYKETDIDPVRATIEEC